MWPFSRQRKNTYEIVAVGDRDRWLKLRYSEDWIEEELAASTAIKSFLAASVQVRPNEREGIEYLRHHGVPEMVSRVATLTTRTLDILKDTGRLEAAVGNNITYVHVAWLMDDWEAGTKLLSVCMDPTAREYFPLTPFWREYYRGIEHFATQSPYTFSFKKAEGYERYWVPYLKLVEDLTHHRSPTDTLEEVKVMCAKRNSDKRLRDWYGFDGDGLQPVCWDFRQVSMRRAFARFYSDAATIWRDPGDA